MFDTRKEKAGGENVRKGKETKVKVIKEKEVKQR